MVWIEQTPSTPEENLALDEALLDYCEEQDHQGILRFWESPEHFVVVGYSNRIDTEVNRDECGRMNFPILRRCSGGGTVVQGTGCYNYALVLPIESRADFEAITGTNRFIMERNRAALAALTGLPVQVQGHTDLAVDNVKFSGNAQRRKRKHLLFHGSFLLKFDLPLVGKLLKFPSHQPDYRAGRPHRDFIRNFPTDSHAVRNALVTAWNARQIEALPGAVLTITKKLLHDKYSTREWNEKF